MSARTTIKVWERWVNEHGGLSGHPVEVVVADDGGDPARYLALVRDMVENQKVLAFVGNMVPLSITGAQGYLEEHQIPAVGGDLSALEWFESPMHFPQGMPPNTPQYGSARAAVDAGASRIALLYCVETEACSLTLREYEAGAVRQAGGEWVYTAQISLAQPDFTSECLQIRNRGATAVVVAADGNTLIRVARSCAQQGLDVTYVAYGLALTDAVLDEPALEGMVGTTNTFLWFLKDGPAAEYGAALAAYAPDLELQGAMSAVWSAGALMQAATRNLPEHPTTADILAGLYALRGETLGGLAPPLTFRQGQPAPAINCYWNLRVRNRQFEAQNGLDLTCY